MLLTMKLVDGGGGGVGGGGGGSSLIPSDVVQEHLSCATLRG